MNVSKKSNKIYKIIISALFAAIIAIATFIIRIPSFGPSGYINIGDSIILICALILGGYEAIFASAIGSMLADLFAGYALYMPGTFVVKSLMVLVIILMIKLLEKFKFNKVLKLIISALCSEVVMILGYFIYESIFLGYGFAAAAMIPSNIIQAGSNIIIGILLYLPIKNLSIFKMDLEK